MKNSSPDIFDVLLPDNLENAALDLVSASDTSDLESGIAQLEKKIEDYSRKREADKNDLLSEVRSLIQSEVSKIDVKKEIVNHVVNQIVEKTVEKQPIIQNYHVPAPAPKPEIVREITHEVRVEVPKKDTRDLVEKSQIEALLKRIDSLEKELKETNRRVDTPIVIGGPGVIGIPPPEGYPVGYVLTTNSERKASWQAATGGSSSGSNPTYIGDPSTAVWRFYDDGTNLICQFYDGASWVEKGTFLQ